MTTHDTRPTDDEAAITAAVRRRLPPWYRRHKRDLPWRRTSDPYAIWVSEIMLQQTRVDTAGPYFLRWMNLFPTVEALAAAPLARVLKAWQGLGYYHRARNLHRAAAMVVRRHGGSLPDSVEWLRRLPGVGDYTAAAIASIAFGRRTPVLDGNVIRVLCRLFAVTGNPQTARTQHRLRSLAENLMPSRGSAGDFNQALMELGATVCTPRRPVCDRCPARVSCLARSRGLQDKLPAVVKRPAIPHVDAAIGVVRKAGRILIDRRPAHGLLAGLWEFPGGKIAPGESAQQAVRREILEELGIDVEVGPPMITIRHAYSHFRVTLHVFHCRWRSGKAQPIRCDAVKWVRPADLSRYAFPRSNEKIIEALLNSSAATT